VLKNFSKDVCFVFHPLTLQTLPTTWCESADDLSARPSRHFLSHGVNQLMI
jgi:hypothetical protein